MTDVECNSPHDFQLIESQESIILLELTAMPFRVYNLPIVSDADCKNLLFNVNWHNLTECSIHIDGQDLGLTHKSWEENCFTMYNSNHINRVGIVIICQFVICISYVICTMNRIWISDWYPMFLCKRIMFWLGLVVQYLTTCHLQYSIVPL